MKGVLKTKLLQALLAQYYLYKIKSKLSGDIDRLFDDLLCFLISQYERKDIDYYAQIVLAKINQERRKNV